MTVPTLDEFKVQFARDFAFAVPVTSSGDPGDPENDDLVMDTDILTAQDKASMLYNESFWSTPAQVRITFNLLTAHFLVVALQAASQGAASAGFWLTSQKRASDLGEAYRIPDIVARNPALAQLSKTQYGIEYLTFAAPRMVGNVAVVRGTTQIL